MRGRSRGGGKGRAKAAPARETAEPAASPLRRILDGASREALVDLLLRRAGADPDLAAWIEIELTAVPGRGTVDPAPIAAQARAILARRQDNSRDDYEAHGTGAALRELVDKASPFLEAGDGRNALTILMAVAEPLAEQWHGYPDYVGEALYTLFRDLTERMAEAALVSDLAADEREALRTTIEGWAADFNDYAPEDGFFLVTAALAGWDDPALRAVLDGEGGAVLPENEEGRDLVRLRLKVLAASERSEAYLNLARAAGDGAALAEMLVRLGRIDDAVAHATEHVADPSAILTLARRLNETGHPDEAITVAEGGLRRTGAQRDGSVAPLARWLRDEARLRKHRDLALEAARAAFVQGGCSLADYQAARTVAGKTGWDPVRDDLLAILDEADHAHDRIAILLEEGLVGDAMAAADSKREGYVKEAVLMRLAEAALERDPAWVIRFAEAKANPLLTQGPHTYEQAAAWLGCAKQGYLANGQQMAWAARIGDLITEHKRRRTLKPLLEALR